MVQSTGGKSGRDGTGRLLDGQESARETGEGAAENWYSGSDTSGSVRSGVEELDATFDALSPAERVQRLEGLLAMERETNWRGYMLCRIGMNHFDAGSVAEATRAFHEALSCFDPLEPTIHDVFPQYGWSIHFLIKEDLFEAGKYEEVVALGSVLLANLPRTRLDDFEASLSLAYVGRALAALAATRGAPLLHTLARALLVAAHLSSPREPDFLEHVVYACFNVQDLGGCRKALALFEAAQPPEVLARRVREFVRTKLPSAPEPAKPM